MTPAAFRQELANAYDGRDREKMERALRVFTDPDLKTMTRERLEERRNVLHVQLAAVNDQLQRHDRLRNAQKRADYEAEEAREQLASRPSLDASE